MATNSYQRLLLAASFVLALAAAAATPALAQAINEHPTPTGSSFPIGITWGPDGALWYTEQNVNKIGRILPTGVTTTEFPTLTGPSGITAGPDGALWFTLYPFLCCGDTIGRIATDGVITYFTTTTPGSDPARITTGPDGNLWFTENVTNKIGCVTPTVPIKPCAEYGAAMPGGEFTIAAGSSPLDITVGSDNSLWFTENLTNKIGKLIVCTTTIPPCTPLVPPQYQEFSTFSPGSSPEGITAGPDGKLWFTENAISKIGRMTTAGVSLATDEFLTPTNPGSAPTSITAGPNGALWFTEYGKSQIGRITTAGVITEYPTKTTASFPWAITVGPGGNPWFTETGGANPGEIASFVLNNTHDYNGDGVSDILWYSTSQSAVGQWQMAPNPTLTPPLGKVLFAGGFFFNEPSQWSPIGQGEFIGNFAMANGTVAPGNGDADILWRDTLGNVGMWLMNSTQFLSGGVFGQVSTNWSVVGVGDLNGDGKADLVWQDNQGDVGIWLNTSTKFTTAQGLTFNPMVLGVVPTQWKVVGSDKYGDIFLQSCPSGTCVGGQVSMWGMNGFNIENIVNLGVPANFRVAGLGDFDGNGSEDVLLVDSGGDVGIWLLSGGKIINAGPVAPPAGWPASNWSIVQTGDFNGDGFSDILFFDGSGNVGIWYMKGLNVVAFTTFPSAGGGWVPQGLNSD